MPSKDFHTPNKGIFYCLVCHKEHEPNKECIGVVCEYDKHFLHEPIPKEATVTFKGWKFSYPFRCMCCGKKICIRQFCFGRYCGICDTGRCFHSSKGSRRPYSGPRELVNREAENFIEDDCWANPETGLVGEGENPYPNPKKNFPLKPKPRITTRY